MAYAVHLGCAGPPKCKVSCSGICGSSIRVFEGRDDETFLENDGLGPSQVWVYLPY